MYTEDVVQACGLQICGIPECLSLHVSPGSLAIDSPVNVVPVVSYTLNKFPALFSTTDMFRNNSTRRVICYLFKTKDANPTNCHLPKSLMPITDVIVLMSCQTKMFGDRIYLTRFTHAMAKQFVCVTLKLKQNASKLRASMLPCRVMD